MKVIYIAGPYRAATEYEVLTNIHAAERAAVVILRAGAMPICPHKNTAHLGGVVPDGIILEGDLAILRKCDAVYALNGWCRSVGATAEVQEARRRKIIILHAVRDVKTFAGSAE